MLYCPYQTSIDFLSCFIMNDDKIKDKGGRRWQDDRRTGDASDAVLGKRRGRDRRRGSDRRDGDDPVIRITGDERRKAFRDTI